MTTELNKKRIELVEFVSLKILPHEAELRSWLTKIGVNNSDLDDVIQESYYRLMRNDLYANIKNPKAYFFTIAKNIFIENARRNKIIPFSALQLSEDTLFEDNKPNAETITADKEELKLVLNLISGLPKRCRMIFELRRVHGYSQNETAKKLSITENIVEKETAKGLHFVMDAIAKGSTNKKPLNSINFERFSIFKQKSFKKIKE